MDAADRAHQSYSNQWLCGFGDKGHWLSTSSEHLASME
jgi:hypothetical protein